MELSLFMVILPSVLALQYHDVCLNDQTLNKFMNFTACENVTCIDYNFSQNVLCEYGCDNSTMTCSPSPVQGYGIFIVIIIIILVSFGIIFKLYGGR